MTAGSLTKPNVLRVTQQFLQLAKAQNAETVTERVRSQLEIYRKREFQLLVVGEVKKGKSFFINALLGEPDLLPIDTHVATSTVYKVMYGDTKKYKIFFNPTFNSGPLSQYEEAQPPIETTDPKKVAEYGTENQNPKNEKEVARIEVYLPNPILKSGAVIIDTPGLDSLFAEHGEIPWCYASTASAICFVLDSVEAPVTAQAMANLKGFLRIAKRTSGSTPFLFFVQTKTDLVEQEGWQTYRDRNMEVIKKNLPEYFTGPEVELHYFPVSSELEELANAADTTDTPDSGFSLVHECLEGVLQEYEERSARELLDPMKSITESNLLPQVVNKQAILRETHTAKGMEYQDELAEIQARLDKWQRDIFPQVQKDFHDRAATLKMNADERLERELGPSASSDLIEPLIAHLKESSSQISAKEIKAAADTIQADFVEVCNEKIFDILGTYQNQMNELIQGNGKKLLDSLMYDGTVLSIREISSNRKLDTSLHDSAYMIAKVGLIITGVEFFTTGASAAGAGAACTCAGAVGAGAVGAGTVGAILNVALPILGVIIVAGALYVMYRHAKKIHVLQTIQSLEALLTTVVEGAHIEAALQFKRIVHAYEKGVDDFFQKTVSEIITEANRNISAIKEASNLDTKAYDQKTNALKAQAKEITEMLDTLKGMLGSNAQAAPAIS